MGFAFAVTGMGRTGACVVLKMLAMNPTKENQRAVKQPGGRCGIIIVAHWEDSRGGGGPAAARWNG